MQPSRRPDGISEQLKKTVLISEDASFLAVTELDNFRIDLLPYTRWSLLNSASVPENL
jgi:hypothetical protein